MLRHFEAAQVEMFNLAQLICEIAAPATQYRLEEVRREIIEQIHLAIKVPTGARVVTKRIPNDTLTWSEFQLTPEIAVDPSITNNAVLFPLLHELKHLLRTQCGLVNTLTLGRL